MKLLRHLLPLSAVTFLAGGIHTPAVAANDSAVITIQGTVKDNTCTLEQPNGAFTLPDVSLKDLKPAWTQVEPIKIPLKFKDCGRDTGTVKVSVSGQSSGDFAFKNELEGQEGGATGVGILFKDTDGAIISSLNSSSARDQQLKPGNNTLEYFAGYQSLNDNVVPGAVRAKITMKFTYE